MAFDLNARGRYSGTAAKKSQVIPLKSVSVFE